MSPHLEISLGLSSLSLSLYVSQRWRGSVRPAGERVGIPPPSEAACECTGFGMSWTLQPHSLPPPHWWGQSSPLLLTSLTGCLSCPSSALLWKINTFALAALQTKAQALRLAEALLERAKAGNQLQPRSQLELEQTDCTYRHYGNRMPAQHC